MPLAIRRRRAAQGFVLVLLVVLAGCQGLAVPRPNPDFRAGGDPADSTTGTFKVGSLAPAPKADDGLPPLPVADRSDDAPSPQPTPLLDAALARAAAQKQAVLSDIAAVAPDATSADEGARPEELPRDQQPIPDKPLHSETTLSPASDQSAKTQEPPGTTRCADNSDNSATGTREKSASNENTQPETRSPAAPVVNAEGASAGSVREVIPQEGAAIREHDREPGESAQTSLSDEHVLLQMAASISNEKPEIPLHHDSQSPPVPALPTPDDERALEIVDVRLCRRVLGFGNIEAIDPRACKAGQAVILYCEMVGVRYDFAQGSYHSQLSALAEIVADTGGNPLWSQFLGTANDTCTRLRHDYYVSYRLSLPDTLPPGSYALRLTQTDVIGQRNTTNSLLFSIQP